MVVSWWCCDIHGLCAATAAGRLQRVVPRNPWQLGPKPRASVATSAAAGIAGRYACPHLPLAVALTPRCELNSSVGSAGGLPAPQSARQSCTRSAERRIAFAASALRHTGLRGPHRCWLIAMPCEMLRSSACAQEGAGGRLLPAGGDQAGWRLAAGCWRSGGVFLATKKEKGENHRMRLRSRHGHLVE